MKPHCIMCEKEIALDEKRYRKYGNYCMCCSAAISRLSLHYPSCDFMVSKAEFNKMGKKRKLWYKKKIEVYKEKLAYYHRASNIYIRSIT